MFSISWQTYFVGGRVSGDERSAPIHQHSIGSALPFLSVWHWPVHWCALWSSPGLSSSSVQWEQYCFSCQRKEDPKKISQSPFQYIFKKGWCQHCQIASASSCYSLMPQRVHYNVLIQFSGSLQIQEPLTQAVVTSKSVSFTFACF